MGTDATRQKYGLMEQEASGIDHTWWRTYESKSGRWTSPDPYTASMSVSDPQSFNRYSYVENDPLNRIDPSGLDEVITIDVHGSPWSWSNGGWGGGGGEGKNPNADTLQKFLWGFERRLPPNPAQPQATGDCARFADRVAEIASRHNDVGDFVDDLARTFIGVASSSVYDMRPEVANTSTGEYFSSTGFRAGLFDDVSDNQARHFMGGLIAGYNDPSGGTVASLVMAHNEDSQADLRVNEISIPLGAGLTNPRRGEIVDRGDRGGWRRIPATPGFKALADMIRNQICSR